MINSATAIHNINFFRDRATKYAPPRPSLSEWRNPGEYGNTTISSQRSHSRQGSYGSAAFESPVTFDSSLSRHKRLGEHKLSTTVDQDFSFGPIPSRKASQSTTKQTGSSPFLGRINGGRFSESSNPQADTDLSRSQICAESRPGSPFIVQTSEAAQHERFTRPITPFADKRQEVISRRETIQSASIRTSSLELGGTRSSTPDMSSLELSRSLSQTPETGNYYHPRPRRSHKASSALAMHSFRSHTASRVPSSEPARSIETLSPFSQDTQSRPRSLKKKSSFSILERSVSRHTTHPQAPETVADSILAREAENDEFKHILKPKPSTPATPALHTKQFYEESGDGGIDHFFVGTGDEYERYMHVPIARTTPIPVSEEPKKKEVRKAKSFASMRSWATNDTEKTVRPRKSSLFRREPQKGDSIHAKTISEPFLMEFSTSPALQEPESRSKEYTRKWFIEQGRADRYGLNQPAGSPMKDENIEQMPEPKKKMPRLVKNILRKEEDEVVVVEREFEMPRATPKPLVRPERQRLDTIFPRRAPPRPRKEVVKNYTAIELGKYAKYPGKEAL